MFRDLLATFVFVALFWITDNIFVATAFGMALGISQTLWTRLRGRAVGPLQWLTLVLITVFGGATILFHNAHFIMVKPTLLWLALGITAVATVYLLLNGIGFVTITKVQVTSDLAPVFQNR